MSFLDYLLAGDETGELRAIVDAQSADLAAGITWGVYDGGRLVETAPARYLAESARHDIADGADRPTSDYEIRPMGPMADQGRQLLVAVNRWRRENGWEAGWSGPTWQSKDRLTGVDFNPGEPYERAVKVSHRADKRVLWPLYGQWHHVSSVRQAVDLLVYLEVLPAEFSSAYEVGAAHAIASCCGYHPVGVAA